MLIQNKRYLAWAPVVIWWLLITILSVLPSVELPHFDLFAPDKLGHALAYAGLTGLSLLAARRLQGQAPDFRTSLLIFVFAAAYGVLMEIVQGVFLPHRSFEFDDMLANTFGAALAWLLGRWYFRRHSNS